MDLELGKPIELNNAQLYKALVIKMSREIGYGITITPEESCNGPVIRYTLDGTNIGIVLRSSVPIKSAYIAAEKHQDHVVKYFIDLLSGKVPGDVRLKDLKGRAMDRYLSLYGNVCHERKNMKPFPRVK